MTGADPEISDTVFWKTVFELARSTAITSRVLYVAGVQWAVWLASSQLKTIEEFQVHFCIYLLSLLHCTSLLSSVDEQIKKSNVLCIVMSLTDMVKVCLHRHQWVE